MNVEQIKQLMVILKAEYGSKVDITEDRIGVWQVILGHCSYNEAQLAIARLLSEARPFPPSVGEINQEVIRARTGDSIDWAQLWNDVYQAGTRSLYYAEEEAKKLPPKALQAIGGVPGLKEIAKGTPEHMGVIRAQFRQRLEAINESHEVKATREGLLKTLPNVNVLIKQIG
jgi:hypothetical protein